MSGCFSSRLGRRPSLRALLLEDLPEDPLEIFQRLGKARPASHSDLVDDGPALRVALDQAAVGKLLEGGIDGTRVRLIASALPDLAGEGLSVHRTAREHPEYHERKHPPHVAHV